LAQILNALLIFFIVGIALTTGKRQIHEDPDLNTVHQFVHDNQGFTYDALRTPNIWVLLLGASFVDNYRL
jgi:hypothetical protein